MKNRTRKNSPDFGLQPPNRGNHPENALRRFCNGILAICNGTANCNQNGGIANAKFGVRAEPFNGGSPRACNGIVKRDGDSDIAKQSRKGLAPSMAGASCAWTAAANESEAGEYSAPEFDAICAENENSDGWYLIAPYGDFPHKVGTQHFDAFAANEITRAFNSGWQRLKRACGFGTVIPVYRGHPDVGPDGRPGISERHFDHSVYGKVEDLAAGAEGLRAKISWATDFARLPRGLRFSPFWFMKTLSEGVHRPTFLKSIGLTATPNIPFTSAANEGPGGSGAGFGDGGNLPPPPAASTKTKENEMLKSILKALGFSETEVSATVENRDGALTEAAVLEKIKSLADSAANSDAAKKEAEAQAAAAQSAQSDAENELRRKERELAEQTAAAANERAAFADYVVNAAIRAGKLTEADRATRTKALQNAHDLVAAANELEGRPPVVATDSETDELKKGDAKAAARKAFNELVAKYEAGVDDHATATVRAKREMPEQYKLAFES